MIHVKRKASLLAALLVVLSGFLITSAAGASARFSVVRVYWGTDRPLEVSPGEAANLSVLLRWESAISVKSLKAELLLPDGIRAQGGGVSAIAFYTSSVSLSSIIQLGFQLFIEPELDLGNYTSSLVLGYHLNEWNYIEDTVPVYIDISGKPSLDVLSGNQSVTSGVQTYLLTLVNEGDGVAENVGLVKASLQSGVAQIPSSAGPYTIGPGENVTIPLSLLVPSESKTSLLPLTIDLAYIGPRTVPYTVSRTVQLKWVAVYGSLPLQVSVTPQELAIGKINKLLLEVRNTGVAKVSDVKITLSTDAVSKVFGRNTLYVKEVASGSTEQVSTDIYVPATANVPTSTLSLTVNYFDDSSGIVQTEQVVSSLLLRGLIEISLTDTATIPSTPSPGKPFSVTMTVTNIGTSAAYACYAIPVLERLPVKPLGPRSVYIGNIEINLPTAFTLNLQMDNTTEKLVTLPITLSYMDNLRTLRTVNFTVPITVGSQTSSTDGGDTTGERVGLLLFLRPVVLLPVAAVVVVAILLLYRRKRRVE